MDLLSNLNRKKLYYSLQGLGWGAYALVLIAYYAINGIFRLQSILSAILVALLGLAISHAWRHLLLHYRIRNLPTIQLVPLLLLMAILLGILQITLSTTLEYLISLLVDYRFVFANWSYFVTATINATLLFLLWVIIYMAAYYFRNFRKAELEQLKREAYANELEINVLRSQLNPHFMFNALNSVRALIDENPETARQAINRLGRLLRQSLLATKKNFVPLKEEMQAVSDFLALEKLRYEDRLDYTIDYPDNLDHWPIPPMMLQTLAENAIKHGISKQTQGGKLRIQAFQNDTKLNINLINTGQLQPILNPSTGIGLDTTKQRLQIYYDQQAHFELKALNEHEVIAQIQLPFQQNQKPKTS